MKYASESYQITQFPVEIPIPIPTLIIEHLPKGRHQLLKSLLKKSPDGGSIPPNKFRRFSKIFKQKYGETPQRYLARYAEFIKKLGDSLTNNPRKYFKIDPIIPMKVQPTIKETQKVIRYDGAVPSIFELINLIKTVVINITMDATNQMVNQFNLKFDSEIIKKTARKIFTENKGPNPPSYPKKGKGTHPGSTKYDIAPRG